jgi:MYXO-CTERM domain-containing protein/uncharacterized repeat protein (TIGR01451 family)
MDEGPFSFLNMDTPFVQLDGTYQLVGGSERAYTLPPGDKFHDRNVVMIKDATTTVGTRSVWMTGYIDGKCTMPKDDVGTPVCTQGVGKISYLGGHKYSVSVPISQNPDTNGTRLFLNSLFEASCTTTEGQPRLSLTLTGPTWTSSGQATYTLAYANGGPGPAPDVVLTQKLPRGATYVSSTGGGTHAAGVVTWKVGDLAKKGGGSYQLSVTYGSHGTYDNAFSASYLVGMNTRSKTSNTVQTAYQDSPPADGGNGTGPGLDTGASCDCSLSSAGPPVTPLLLLVLLLFRRRRRPDRG